jgi:hypothetical protein
VDQTRSVEPTEENLRAWTDAHGRGEPPVEPGLPEAVRERLPGLGGRHVLQLGGGPSRAAELVELGALVTAVASSAETIADGHEAAPTVAWIAASLEALPVELRRGRFHLVLADVDGVRDAKAWAAGVEAALLPGGYALVFGAHPAGSRLDAMLRWRGDYFDGELPTLGAFVTVLARSGLVVRRLEELPTLHHQQRRRVAFPGAFVLVAVRPLS